MSKSAIKAFFSPVVCLLAGFVFAAPDTTVTLTGGAAQARAQGGLANAPIPVPLRIKLPFKAGESYKVIQGNHGDFTHSDFNEYAWDFALPLNTPVCAAAAGRVVRVKQDGTSGGPRSEFFGQGNALVIDHGNGYFSHYLHLAPGSAKVSEGDIVKAGQVIALSGNTGFSSTPHLHFHVQDATGRSLPTKFLDVQGNGIPRENDIVTSGNDGSGTSQYTSESHLPPDVFTANSIQLLTRNLPAHIYRTNQTYSIRGRVANSKSSRIAIYFMPSTGGSALCTTYADVNSSGFFQAELNPAQLKILAKSKWSEAPSQSNPYSLAIAPVKPDGSFWSDVSIPVCVR